MPFIFSVESNSQEVCWKENNAATKKCRKYTSCNWSSTWKTQLSKNIVFHHGFSVAPNEGVPQGCLCWLGDNLLGGTGTDIFEARRVIIGKDDGCYNDCAIFFFFKFVV